MYTDKRIEEKAAELVIDAGSYWNEHPDYPVSDWQEAIEAGDTRRGYWQWVACQILFM